MIRRGESDINKWWEMGKRGGEREGEERVVRRILRMFSNQTVCLSNCGKVKYYRPEVTVNFETQIRSKSDSMRPVGSRGQCTHTESSQLGVNKS